MVDHATFQEFVEAAEKLYVVDHSLCDDSVGFVTSQAESDEFIQKYALVIGVFIGISPNILQGLRVLEQGAMVMAAVHAGRGRGA